jgi:hypothetical protein
VDYGGRWSNGSYSDELTWPTNVWGRQELKQDSQCTYKVQSKHVRAIIAEQWKSSKY